MLFDICRIFSFIPLELKLFHMYIVLILMNIASCVYEAERLS